jgi:hypothetical protein
MLRRKDDRRIIPGDAITVAIGHHDIPCAYGAVANISGNGGCIWTDGRFRVGESLRLCLSFAREHQPVEAYGRVMWCEASEDDATVRYGFQWQETARAEQDRLARLLARIVPQGKAAAPVRAAAS